MRKKTEAYAGFLRAVPVIMERARLHFRSIRCPHYRDDLIAESLAFAWKFWGRAQERGRDPGTFPGAIGKRACQHVAQGNRLCGVSSADDVLAEYRSWLRSRHIGGQGRQEFTVSSCHQELDGGEQAEISELGQDQDIPGVVATRLDMEAWLAGQTASRQTLFRDMLAGADDSDLVQAHGLTIDSMRTMRSDMQSSLLACLRGDVAMPAAIPVNSGQPLELRHWQHKPAPQKNAANRRVHWVLNVLEPLGVVWPGGADNARIASRRRSRQWAWGDLAWVLEPLDGSTSHPLIGSRVDVTRLVQHASVRAIYDKAVHRWLLSPASDRKRVKRRRVDRRPEDAGLRCPYQGARWVIRVLAEAGVEWGGGPANASIVRLHWGRSPRPEDRVLLWRMESRDADNPAVANPAVASLHPLRYLMEDARGVVAVYDNRIRTWLLEPCGGVRRAASKRERT